MDKALNPMKARIALAEAVGASHAQAPAGSAAPVDVCPECGSEALVRFGRYELCHACGYAACGA